MIHKVKLFTNHNEKSKEIEKSLTKLLHENDIEVCKHDYDLGIAIGGDGSFLRMLKQSNFNSDISYVGINTGTLGFLQEIKPKEIENFVKCIKEDKFKIEQIGIQETKVMTEKDTSLFYSLNDIVIRDKELNTTILDIKVNHIYLETFVGDGILISTSVGSTAYNMSYGGSIVYNTLHTLQITPMAPLNSKVYRSLLTSIIIPENDLITIFPKEDKRNLIITVDGENNCYKDVREIQTIVSKKKIQCLRMNDYNFIKIVEDKLL